MSQRKIQREFIKRYEPENSSPLLTSLSFSAGSQSTAILEMVLRGELEKPAPFIVLAADPGMEDARSYKIRDAMLQRCAAAGIHAEVVPGKDLFQDMIDACQNGKKRADNPPLWVLDEDGNVGQLMQKCTREYKIRPMARAIRRRLKAMEITTVPDNAVEQWIGFAYDERHRIKPSDERIIQFRYPLIDRKMTRNDVSNKWREWGISEPPTSVCNACFANGLDKFRWMHQNSPECWKQAVEFDNALRGPHGVPGVRGTCYVSRTCIPLEQLANMNFELPPEYNSTREDYSCDSGFCFA